MSEEDKEWKDLNEGVYYLLMEQKFIEKYGEPPLHWWQIHKFKRWLRELRIFIDGSIAGQEHAFESINRAGWLKDEVNEP